MTFVNSSSIVSKWSPPHAELQNGIIAHYYICVKKYQEPDKTTCATLNGTQDSHVIVDLIPYTKYSLSISAGTIVGYGPSTLLIQRTSQAGQKTIENKTASWAVKDRYLGVGGW